MTTPPFRPLPVGAVPAWLLGPLCIDSTPFSPLPPSPLHFVAELIRQDEFMKAPHTAHPDQLSGTAPSENHPDQGLDGPVLWGSEACSTTAPDPFPGFPIGDTRAFPTPTVSAPNRPKRDICCSARTPPILAAAPPCWRLNIGCPVVYSKTQCYIPKH